MTLTEPGTYFHLVAAQDAGAAQDKGHRNQWGLPLAKPESKPLALNVDFEGYPVPPPLKTTPLAEEAARRQGVLFDGSGYAGVAKKNLSAREWIDEITTKKPALVHYVGHGGSQFIGNQYYLTPWKPGLAASAIGWSYLIHMDNPSSQYSNTNWFGGLSGLFNKRAGSAGPIVCLETEYPVSNPANAKMFDSVLLAVLEGCKTANDGKRAGWGSPAYGLLERGAFCVIGFTEIIYIDRVTPQGKEFLGAETWSRKFWSGVSEGFTVRDAVTRACRATNGSNMALGQTRIFQQGVNGSAQTGKFRIHPARYNVAPTQ